MTNQITFRQAMQILLPISVSTTLSFWKGKEGRTWYGFFHDLVVGRLFSKDITLDDVEKGYAHPGAFAQKVAFWAKTNFKNSFKGHVFDEKKFSKNLTQDLVSVKDWDAELYEQSDDLSLGDPPLSLNALEDRYEDLIKILPIRVHKWILLLKQTCPDDSVYYERSADGRFQVENAFHLGRISNRVVIQQEIDQFMHSQNEFEPLKWKKMAFVIDLLKMESKRVTNILIISRKTLEAIAKERGASLEGFNITEKTVPELYTKTNELLLGGLG